MLNNLPDTMNDSAEADSKRTIEIQGNFTWNSPLKK